MECMFHFSGEGHFEGQINGVTVQGINVFLFDNCSKITFEISRLLQTCLALLNRVQLKIERCR